MALTATQEELLQLLDQDEEFRQQIRQRVLSTELLELPEQFAAFASRVNEFIIRQEQFNAEQRDINARVDEFITEQKGTNARVDEFITEQRITNARVDEFITEQKGTNARVDEFITEQRITNARVDQRLQRISDDIGELKGHAALRATRDHSATILERLGLEYVTILYRRELIDLARQATDIAPGDRQSFIRADLMLQGEAADGTTHYVAAEASYTADRRDTDRALRNAEFLTRLTGCPAHAVISSLKNDRAVQSLVDDGTVHWFQLTNKDLDPE